VNFSGMSAIRLDAKSNQGQYAVSRAMKVFE